MDKYPEIGWALYHPLHTVVDIIIVYRLYTKCVKYKIKYGMVLIFRGLKLIFIAFIAWLLDFFLCDLVHYLYLHAFGWHIFSGLAIAHLHLGLAILICIENKKSHLKLNYWDYKIKIQ